MSCCVCSIVPQLNSVVLFCLQYCTTSSTLQCCPVCYCRPTTSSAGRCYPLCNKYPTVPTSNCDLVSATKPFVGFSWNSLYDFFTKCCRINTRFVTVTAVKVIILLQSINEFHACNFRISWQIGVRISTESLRVKLWWKICFKQSEDKICRILRMLSPISLRVGTDGARKTLSKNLSFGKISVKNAML